MIAGAVRILLTGFGAFPGAPVNPTQAIVQRLQRRSAALARSGIQLEIAILPVAYAQAEEMISTLIAQHRPDVIVHLGLAAGRETISIETRARNRLNIILPDANGKYAPGLQIKTNAPAIRHARWPAARLAQAIRGKGVPARQSIDAGNYLCNQLLFISLGLHDGLCGFIHVPEVAKKRRARFIFAAQPLAFRADRPISHKPAKRRIGTRPGAALADMEKSVLTAMQLLATEHRNKTFRF